jgi:hypothetical protein
MTLDEFYLLEKATEHLHSTSCYVEKCNNGAGDTFWVCKPGCAALRAKLKLRSHK